MTSNQTRVPEGVPTGGQFAASARGEADAITLADITDDALLAEALGDGPDLTADDQRLLGILLDPKVNEFLGNDTDFDLMLDDLESNGDDSSFDGAEAIAERLWAHYERAEGPEDRAGDFSFRLNRSHDGVESYSVGCYLGHDEGVWLSEAHDSKYIAVDRNFHADASGLRKAVVIASVIDGDYQALRAKGARLGLMPAVGETSMPAPAPVWPQDDDERAAYRDYQSEVANGDAAESFRDWYENRLAEEAATEEMHSIGSPSCPAVYGGSCSIPLHDESTED